MVPSAITALDASSSALRARSQILSVPTASLGFADGEPVAFEAIVLLVTAQAAVWDDIGAVLAGAAAYDAVPDDAVEAGGIGTGRLRYSDRDAPYRFAPWSIALAAHGGRQAEVRWRALAPMRLPNAFVVAFPENPSGPGDLQWLDIQLGTGRPAGTNPLYLGAVQSGRRR